MSARTTFFSSSHFQVPLCLCFKTRLSEKTAHTKMGLHENEPLGVTKFPHEWFTLRLVLMQRQWVTRRHIIKLRTRLIL